MSRRFWMIFTVVVFAACDPQPEVELNDSGVPDSGTSSDSGSSICRSDRECSAMGRICNRMLGICVECLQDTDCASGEACRSGVCEAVVPCASSRMCAGLVCDLERGYCVECITQTDCEGEQICRDGDCVDPPRGCSSDRECSEIGLVCSMAAGHCVECVSDLDCSSDRYCGEGGACLADICTPGETQCVSPLELAVCLDNGAGFGVATACGAAAMCMGGACHAIMSDAGMNDAGMNDAGMNDAGRSFDAGVDAGAPPLMCRPAGSSCDLLRQDCPGGQACAFVDGAARCVSSGVGGDGSGCSRQSDCRAGFWCESGICRRYCCHQADEQCLEGQRCLPSGDDIGACRAPDACSLVPQSGCPANQGCYVTRTDGVRNCVGAGTAREGESCSALNECEPGTICTTEGICARFCRISGDDCQSDQRCISLGFSDRPEIGLCSPPRLQDNSIRIPTAASRVLVTDASDLYPQVFTYELWIAFDSLATTDPGQTFLSAGGTGLFYFRAYRGQLECVIGTGTGETRVQAPLSYITAGRWNHIACTRDSSGNLSLWLDGVRVGITSAPIYSAPNTALGIGGDFRTPPDAFNVFTGVVDEVRISRAVEYVSTFTPSARLSVTPNTIALWNFDEGYGDRAFDAARPSRQPARFDYGATWREP